MRAPALSSVKSNSSRGMGATSVDYRALQTTKTGSTIMSAAEVNIEPDNSTWSSDASERQVQ